MNLSRKAATEVNSRTSTPRPVREVVGKAFPNEVMFLQSPEGVLEDGVFRALAQRIQQLGEAVRLVFGDAQ